MIELPKKLKPFMIQFHFSDFYGTSNKNRLPANDRFFHSRFQEALKNVKTFRLKNTLKNYAIKT